MNRRMQLQEMLERLLGSRNVYFQPPESVKLKYPAIVYGLSDIDTMFADDKVYRKRRKYTVTLIDEDPDSVLVNEILDCTSCSYDRHFTSDNLNHDVFTLYY